MSAPTRTAKEWGQVAVKLPGWQWHPGMLVHFGDWDRPCDHYRMGAGIRGMDTAVPIPGSEWWPDPDDHATAGCLLELLGRDLVDIVAPRAGEGRWIVTIGGRCVVGSTLGRACIAAAEALGLWPGGAP